MSIPAHLPCLLRFNQTWKLFKRPSRQEAVPIYMSTEKMEIASILSKPFFNQFFLMNSTKSALPLQMPYTILASFYLRLMLFCNLTNFSCSNLEKNLKNSFTFNWIVRTQTMNHRQIANHRQIITNLPPSPWKEIETGFCIQLFSSDKTNGNKF